MLPDIFFRNNIAGGGLGITKIMIADYQITIFISFAVLILRFQSCLYRGFPYITSPTQGGGGICQKVVLLLKPIYQNGRQGEGRGQKSQNMGDIVYGRPLSEDCLYPILISPSTCTMYSVAPACDLSFLGVQIQMRLMQRGLQGVFYCHIYMPVGHL